ncbi:MAG TPA: hypothetical protein PKZ29_00785 [Candidatus Woesebacteria bacterium]|jgi:hypothetical protein|nr:hypothetical protein [Candidatus Woesebacteria bacterium]HOG37440.1 hypothetical protein [Candidatus Woesebacteria bacterium]
MLKKITQNKYILILIAIVIILIVIKIISSTSVNNTPLPTNTKPGQPSSPTPSSSNSVSSPENYTSGPSPTNSTSTSQSNSSSTNRITEINYQIPLYNLLPYQGKYFSARRYIGANNLEIIVPRQDQTDLAKQEAQAWFVQNGVDQLDRFTVIYK